MKRKDLMNLSLFQHEEEGFDEHGVKSPAQIHIKSRKEG